MSGFSFSLFNIFVERFVAPKAEEDKKKTIKHTDSLNNFVTRKESPNNELIRRTDDREDWKVVIADVCNRPGT